MFQSRVLGVITRHNNNETEPDTVEPYNDISNVSSASGQEPAGSGLKSPHARRSGTVPPLTDASPTKYGEASEEESDAKERDDGIEGVSTTLSSQDDRNDNPIDCVNSGTCIPECLSAVNLATTKRYVTDPATARRVHRRNDSYAHGTPVSRSSHQNGGSESYTLPRCASVRLSSIISPRSSSDPQAQGPRTSRSASCFSNMGANFNSQLLHYSSVVASARFHTARRASSMRSTVGVDTRSSSRPGMLTEAEALAVERMMEKESRLMEAKERAEHIARQREAQLLSNGLEREKSVYMRIEQRERERKEQIHRAKESHENRKEIAIQRRHDMESSRLQHLEERIEMLDNKFVDPYQTMLAKKRYSTPVLRGEAPTVSRHIVSRGSNADSLSKVNDSSQSRRRSSSSAPIRAWR